MVFGGTYFYFQIIKKMVIVFGSIFNDMVVERVDKDGNETANIRVPISYAAKDKMLARLNADPDLDRPYSELLPRMAFEIISAAPNSNSQLPVLNRKVVKSTNINNLKYQYTPRPYNIRFALYIFAKNAEDATKILEQILPFFTPSWTASVELIPDMNEIRDIPFTLDGMNLQDTYDGDFKQRRVLIWTLDFTCQTYLYGPELDKPIIKFTTVSEIIGDPSTETANDAFESVTMQPGLLANGSPTTDPTQSIPYTQISIDDDWGFAEAVIPVLGD
jgi:hypothetical protein